MCPLLETHRRSEESYNNVPPKPDLVVHAYDLSKGNCEVGGQSGLSSEF